MVEMRTRSNAQSTEVGSVGHENDHPDVVNLSECCENPSEPEEDVDEDEDVDFNPFLKEALSPEASSSLSSEVEVLDSDVGSGGNNIKSTGSDLLKLNSKVQDSEIAESEHVEEGIVMQTTDSPRGPCEKEYQKIVPRKSKKRKSVLTSRQEIESVREKEIGSSSGTDINDVVEGELDNTSHSWKPIMNLDDNDAICMRTRARYSLASFTLDELETFLQETDDEEDLQNVDDEEEYRKFLAAVLCGDGDVQTIQGNENHDEEDEDNDADFEIEIEEALESDTDVNARDKSRKEYGGAGRRPETRQNKRQKSSSLCKNKNSELTKRPLRPILPSLSNVAIAALPTLRGKSLMNETAPRPLSSTAKHGLVNGFTPHQIGQLYCLIHEHVQLLIQIFSICVLDPSRKHIASQVQGLIFEMLHKRDNVLAHKSEPYSGFCFCPPYICPSVPDKFPKIFPAQCSLDAFPTFDAQRGSLLPNNEMPASHITSPFKGGCEYVSDGQVGSFQTTDSYFWVPLISSPILSILDVAPLNLVGRYMDDVSTAVQEYQQHHLRSTCDTPLEREPLFPFPWFSHTEANVESSGGTIPPAAKTAPSSPSQQPSKKTLAAALVERTKKQSVAFVPKQIAKLTQRFLPLFNPALYPHKPPPLAVANRVLFTDTEDELLALGLMEYNTDWKAIQQRFLPCKSKHQIFVRQKNRCSSKAPENPIKAVRRLKTSPLSAEEIARIQEGLRVFKFDWLSVWKLAVPHRDPSLLPRQWRIAHGTQKSYKHSAEQKEKRRLYEASRRKCKAADLENWETGSGREGYQTANTSRETNGGNGYRDNKGEAYVNEGFLSNSRSGATNSICTELPSSDCRENNLPSSIPPQEGPYISGQSNTCGPGEAQSQNGYVHEFPANSANTQHQHISSNSNCVRQSKCNILEANFTSSAVMPNTSKSQFCWLPYRARKNNSARLVKLSPDLPPVNLPSSVYVISQSAFKSYQCGASTKLSGAGGGSTSAGIENIVPWISNVAKSKVSHSLIARQSKIQLKENVSNSCSQESKDFEDTCTPEERGTESDLHMHPLLFQAPEDGRLPYYPINCSTSNPSSFSFFSGNQPHLTLSLCHNPYQANSSITCFNKSLESNELTSRSCGIDFHPLLQRSEDMNTNLIESRGNYGPSSTRTIPSGPSEKANELDLEIHLSSTSRNDKLVGGKDVNAHNLTRSKIRAQGSRTTVETQKTNSLCFRQGENCPTVSSKLISDACSVGALSNNVKRHSMDDIGDQSHPEIVMEQEELSDSDEEEHVEFECEEMDDSEGGEESGCEQIAEMLNRVPLAAANSTVEKVASDSNGDDQQLESRTNGLPQENVFISQNGDTPPNLGLTSQGKDATSRSLWLSLDLSVPSHPLLTKPKDLGSIVGKVSAAKILTSTRPNRSCKKTKPSGNEGTGQKHSVDFLQHLSMGPLAVPPVRKPRKRACRANTSLQIGMTIESTGCDDNVDCCTANTSEC